MLGTTAKGGQNGTSPKTAPPHQEDHLPPGDNNGYFVRPVAVADIFKPALASIEDVSKKPAVPEKRRFSVLAGDLQPCGDTSKTRLSNDEFARRRQSWDTRSSVTVAPFGQDLLKKTAKRTSPSRSPGPSILTEKSVQASSNHSDVQKNYSIVNGLCNDNCVSDKQKLTRTVNKNQDVNSHDTSCHQNGSGARNDIVSQTTASQIYVRKRGSSNITKADLDQIVEDSTPCAVTFTSPERRRQRPKVNQYTPENETECTSARRRSRADRDRIHTTEQCPLENGITETTNLSNGISSDECKIPQGGYNDIINDHGFRSTQSSSAVFTSVNETKSRSRVYGLSKNTTIESNVKNSVNNATDDTILRVSDNYKSTEVNTNSQSIKVATDVIDQLPKTCNKFYGVTKRGSKVEIKSENNSAVLTKASTADGKKEPTISELKTTPEKIDLKVTVAIASGQHVDPKLENAAESNKSANAITSKEKSSSQLETKSVELPKNVRTTRRTSDVIAAKIQSIFSNISVEKSASNNSTPKSDFNSLKKSVVNKTITVEKDSKDAVHVSEVKSSCSDKPTLIEKEVIGKPLPKATEICNNESLTGKEITDKPLRKVVETKKTATELVTVKKDLTDKSFPKTKECDIKTLTSKETIDKSLQKINETKKTATLLSTKTELTDRPLPKVAEIKNTATVLVSTTTEQNDKPSLKAQDIATNQTYKETTNKSVQKVSETKKPTTTWSVKKELTDKPALKTQEIDINQTLANKETSVKPVLKIIETKKPVTVWSAKKELNNKPPLKAQEINVNQTLASKETFEKSKVIEDKKTSCILSSVKKEQSDVLLKNTEIVRDTNKITPTKKELDKTSTIKDSVENEALPSKKVLTETTIKKCSKMTENAKRPLNIVHIKESDKLFSSKCSIKSSKVSDCEAPVLPAKELTTEISNKNALKLEKDPTSKVVDKESSSRVAHEMTPKMLKQNATAKLPDESSTSSSCLPDKKPPSTLKTIKNSSTVKSTIDSSQLNGPLTQKKTVESSVNTFSADTTPSKCPPKVSSVTETNSTNHVETCKSAKTTTMSEYSMVSNNSSALSVTSIKPTTEEQCSTQATTINAHVTQNVESYLLNAQQETRPPNMPGPKKPPVVAEKVKAKEESKFTSSPETSKTKTMGQEPVRTQTNSKEVLKNDRNISPKEPSVRPKNFVNKCVNLNMEDFFKTAAKNLDCCTSPPALEAQSPDFRTMSLSNLATPLSSNLSGSEDSKDLVNGSSSSVESLGSESKTPKPPERKRSSLLRDASLPPPLIPPHSTTVMRTGSLKRFDEPKMTFDKPLSILRSPSHSTLPSYNPHRYSYTEMLSKVCSFGISPSTASPPSTFNPPYKKYSLGSLSSSLSQVAELRSDLLHEQSSSTHTSEMLESETTERMRLEKEVSDLQSRYNHVQKKSNKMEMKMMEARVYRSSEINGDLSDDEEGNASIYKQKYEKAVQDMEIMKRRIQQQREEEIEQNLLTKKAADKKLAEALEDVEEEKQVANQWKRKAQKLGSELQDLRLMLEEQMARNGELEKKQRGFDAELLACKEEIKKERMIREKLLRERDQAQNEKYALEQELHTTRLDMDEKIIQLKQELDELTLSSKGEEEVTLLKRAKQELERKYRDLEEELEEYVDRSNMLEQAKLRLEMSLEKLRQEHRRESSVREEEIEELRASFSKKIKNLEAQVESEQEERHQLVKQKHELERRVIELTDQPPPQDPEVERRLRRDLKRTKALLRDAQSMLDRVRDGQGSKSVVRQLKNQLEDAEFAKCSAIKAKQTAEMELQDLQLQLEEVTRSKNDHESRCLQLSREKSALLTQVEEAEEETNEVMSKYEALVARMSTDQKTIAEQNQQIAELEAEKNALRDQLSEVNTKFEHLAGQTEDTHRTFRLDAKVRDLDSKLELEQTSRTRLEHQITRLKEQIDRLQEECDSLRNKELQAQESTRRFQRQVRELREDYAGLQLKESEAYRKQHELETALESAESELKISKNDLRLACQRIEELKNALEDDLDSGTDVPDDSGSDSDSSLDMSTMMRSSFTPIQRCDSAASDLSFGSRRSVTPSYGDIASLCRGMWRRTSMDFLT